MKTYNCAKCGKVINYNSKEDVEGKNDPTCLSCGKPVCLDCRFEGHRNSDTCPVCNKTLV